MEANVKMKVFVTGVNGQLGYDVMNELKSRGHEAVGSGSSASGPFWDMSYYKMDITDAYTVRVVLLSVKPDAVVHCAAWTAVDAAEDEGNRTKVFAVNAGGTRNIASACKGLGCKMVYISTDYVFQGRG